MVATQETNLYVMSVTQSEPTVVKFLESLASCLLIFAGRFGNNLSMVHGQRSTDHKNIIELFKFHDFVHDLFKTLGLAVSFKNFNDFLVLGY